MSWATRPADWGKPGHAELGSETEAILDQIEYLTDNALANVSYKSANETVNNSTALQNDDHLAQAVVADSVYALEAHIHYNTNSTANLKVGWTFPTGLTMVWGHIGVALVGTFVSIGNQAQTTVLGIGGWNADAHFSLYGLVTVGATAGTLQMQWAQNTANASNTVLYAGSTLILRKV